MSALRYQIYLMSWGTLQPSTAGAGYDYLENTGSGVWDYIGPASEVSHEYLRQGAYDIEDDSRTRFRFGCSISPTNPEAGTFAIRLYDNTNLVSLASMTWGGTTTITGPHGSLPAGDATLQLQYWCTVANSIKFFGAFYQILRG